MKNAFNSLVAFIIFVAGVLFLTPAIKYLGIFVLIGLRIKGDENMIRTIESSANIMGIYISFIFARFLYRRDKAKIKSREIT